MQTLLIAPAASCSGGKGGGGRGARPGGANGRIHYSQLECVPETPEVGISVSAIVLAMHRQVKTIQSDECRALPCQVLSSIIARWTRMHAGPSGRPSDADETGGSILRLLHQLSLATTAADAMARAVPPPVPMLMTAMAGWGLAGSVLSLETLQRALALDNRARDLLIGSALSAGLVGTLLSKLDWRGTAGAGASSSVRL